LTTLHGTICQKKLSWRDQMNSGTGASKKANSSPC